MKHFALSIVIPTWNRKEKLLKLIKLLIFLLSKNKILYEILVCDSNSIDGTKKELKKRFNKKSFVHLLNIKENSISKKRNIGIKNSKYSNILLLDDDCVPKKNFFKILKKYLMESKKKEVFCGQYFTNLKLVANSNYYYFRDLKNLKTYKKVKINYNNIITGCCFFKKKLLKRNFFFNEKIKGYGLEDIDWAHRLKDNKFNLFLTEAKVDHQETSQNMRYYLLKWYMLSRDAMPSLLERKKPKMRGKIFLFENLFLNPTFRLVLKTLNFLILLPLSISLKFFLEVTDKQKIFFSKNLFNLVLFLYYVRGACDRNKQNFKKSSWYNSGYK